MKTLKMLLESKGISQEQFDALEATEKAKLFAELNDINAKAFKELQESTDANSKEIAKANQELLAIVKEQNEAHNRTIKAMSLDIQKANSLSTNKDGKSSMAKELEENKEAIKNIASGTGVEKEVVIKADTLRASVTGNQNALDLQGIGQLAHAKLTAYDIFNKIPVSDTNTNGVIRYYDWDAATTVRAANTIAEGGTFPESTAKWVTKTLPIEKIGDTLPVSEEFYEDSELFAAELGMFLDTNVKIKRNDQIINGDGVTPNLKGIVTTVGAYTPVASGISDASIYDLFVKVSESITATGGSKYSPNFGLMNISDINKMKLKKDANENYIIPPFVSRDGNEVAGMIVLEENAIPANTMVIGDSRYARIYERKGISLTRGYVDTQFVEDMETLKVRTRLNFLIRDADLGGFKKVTDIAAALVTLATP